MQTKWIANSAFSELLTLDKEPTFRKGLLIKYPRICKTSQAFVTLYFGGRGLTMIEYLQLYLWFYKSYKHGTGIRNFRPKLYRSYYMCVPLELYAPYVYWHLMNVSTMHDDKHPFCLKIGTGAVHWYLYSLRTPSWLYFDLWLQLCVLSYHWFSIPLAAQRFPNIPDVSEVGSTIRCDSNFEIDPEYGHQPLHFTGWRSNPA